MRHRVMRTRACLAVLLMGMGLLVPGVWAGIPEPGVVLCGQIWDSSDNLLTNGELNFTFTPAGGGTAVAVKVQLRLIDSAIGQFSYAVMVPVETGVQGYPASSSALAVAATPVTYAWSGVVKGTGISDSGALQLDMTDLGSARRIDFGAVPSPGEFHSGDTDRDNKFSLEELLRELELYSATAEHEYSCDNWWIDGYGLGAGDRTCDTHSGDWEGGADWHISTNELLRMIELFTATPDHSYCSDPSSVEDGFRPGPCGKDAAPGVGLPVLTMVRTITKESDDSLLVTISYSADDFGRISGMALEEWLPLDYQFVAVVSGAAPSIVPLPESIDRLDFVWMGVPQTANNFTYRVRPVSAQTVARADTAFYGEAVYRAKDISGEWRTEVQTARDADGDGVPDASGDVPGVDGSGTPNDPGADADGDGIPDGTDGISPYDLPGSEPLPAPWVPIGLALGGAGLWALRRWRQQR